MRLFKGIYGWAMIAVLILVAIVIRLLCDNMILSAQVESLSKAVEEYQEKEGQSYVVERVSKQMEDIAYQQKDIATRQREEALRQSEVATQMRIHAEEERHSAQQYAQDAAKAQQKAELQERKAIEERRIAEQAKQTADTLSYVALGRSLASFSRIQFTAGNKEIGNLLAYAAWKFTKEYQGDVYSPVFFSALGQNSESSFSQTLHKGSVLQIVNYLNHRDSYVSISEYGEICRWNYRQGKIEPIWKFSNPTYSFRDVCVDSNGVVYALSFHGHLLVTKDGTVERDVVLPEASGFTRLGLMKNRKLLLLSSNSCYFYDIGSGEITSTLPLLSHPTALASKEDQWFLFDEANGFWEILPDGRLEQKECWIKGKVTAAAWSPEHNVAAIGMENGDIYIVKDMMNVIKKLVGHRSWISRVGFKGQFLFSTSYDCDLSLWNMLNIQEEPVTLKTFISWARSLCFAENNTVWIGDATGTVSRVMTSVDEMAQLIRRNLKRDFTADEWNYYIGGNVPREIFYSIDN